MVVDSSQTHVCLSIKMPKDIFFQLRVFRQKKKRFNVLQHLNNLYIFLNKLLKKIKDHSFSELYRGFKCLFI
jgi:hypothetical protein